eukprot:NODE_133_length_18153_cov_0.298050.p7 type:complete len:257 gc:universal NODE_133_length_18153_cov_0.298050:15419-16189(+)
MESFITFLLISLLSGCWILFLRGISKAVIVFKNKSSAIFVFCVLGLIFSITLSSFISLTNLFSINALVSRVVTQVLWLFMIQFVTWMSCLRIKSLGGYFCNDDLYIEYVPWFLLLVQLSISVPTILGLYVPFYDFIAMIMSLTFSVAICLSEIYMYKVLRYKVKTFLEYRRKLRSLLLKELTIALVVLITMEILLIVSKIFNATVMTTGRPFSYLVRIVILVQFYDNLLSELDTDSIVLFAQLYEESYESFNLSKF